jgi:hypothetical protein
MPLLRAAAACGTSRSLRSADTYGRGWVRALPNTQHRSPGYGVTKTTSTQ